MSLLDRALPPSVLPATWRCLPNVPNDRALPLLETINHVEHVGVLLLDRALPLLATISHTERVGPPAGPQYYPPWPAQPQSLTSPGRMSNHQGLPTTSVPNVLDTVSHKVGF